MRAGYNNEAQGPLMENADTLIQVIEQPLNNHSSTPMLYLVKAGDTLSQIITKHYDIRYNDPRYKVAQASVLYFNDSIKDPNEVYVGQLLRLMPLPDDSVIGACSVPENFHTERRALATTRHRLEPQDNNYVERMKHHIPTTPKEQDAFWTLAWLQQNYDLLSVSAGGGINAFGGLVSQSHNAFIAEVKMHYAQYQRGAITENQYDYRRQKSLKTYAKKLGPFEKVLLKGKTAREAVRINRSKALPATVKIDNHLQRLGRMAQTAKYGGVVLTAAGVGMGCYNISNEKNQHKKNEIFVETVASTIAGAASSYGLAVILVSNPVGWFVAIGLGVGAAYGSYQAGKKARSFYNQHGQSIDLVNMSGVDRLCN